MRTLLALSLALLTSAARAVEPDEILQPIEHCFLKTLGVEASALRFDRRETHAAGAEIADYHQFAIGAAGSPYDGLVASVLRLYDGPISAEGRPVGRSVTIIDPASADLFEAQASIFLNETRNTMWTSVFRPAPGPGADGVFEMVGTDIRAGRHFPEGERPSVANGAYINAEEQARGALSTVVFAGPAALKIHERALGCRGGS